MFKEFWDGLGRSAQASLAVGVIVILAMTVGMGVWLLRTDYQVLFADLTPQDSAAMIAELDRMKVPYKLGDNGTSILVDRESVHKTRIKLMGKNFPMHGAVGLELFNNADFGMTEFAQKVNYQRALQGELTRTILSLAEIETARVHLAMPEEGLFRRATSKPKASVTLTMKKGQTLRGEQVAGIQRLVSAAVPGIQTQDVTIVDQHGVALTRPAQGDGESEVASLRLDLKKEMETYLVRKASAVLEQAFGAGQAMASVDVTLNMDQVKVTTEDVVGAPGKGTPSGVIVRERETMRDSGAPTDLRNAAIGGSRSGNSSQREVEYQVGRRVEQLVSSPGSLRKVQLVAVIQKPLDADQIQQIRHSLAAAVGAVPERGDTIVIQSAQTAKPSSATMVFAPVPAAADPSLQGVTGVTDKADGLPEPAQREPTALSWTVIGVLALLFAAVIGIAIGLAVRRTRAGARPLTPAEREAALTMVREWLAKPAGPAGPVREEPGL